MDPVSSGADPTTPLESFNNATISTGGDSKLYNLNVFYDVSWSRAGLLNVGLMDQAGDIAWMITATALVLLMIPGVGYVPPPSVRTRST